MDKSFIDIISRFREELGMLSKTNSEIGIKLNQINNHEGPHPDMTEVKERDNPYIVGTLNDLIDKLARENSILRFNLDHLNTMV